MITATVEPSEPKSWRQLGQQVWRVLHAGVRLSWGTVKATKFDGDKATNIDIEFSVTPDSPENVGKITSGMIMVHNGWFGIRYTEKLSTASRKDFGDHWQIEPREKPAKIIDKLKFLLDPDHQVRATVEPGTGFTAQRAADAIDTLAKALQLPRTANFHVVPKHSAAYVAKDRAVVYFDVLTVAAQEYRGYAFSNPNSVTTGDEISLMLAYKSHDADEVTVRANVFNTNAGVYKIQTQAVTVSTISELRKAVGQLLGEVAHRDCTDLEAKYAHWTLFHEALARLDFNKHLHTNVVLKETVAPYVASGDEVHRFKFEFTYGPDKKLRKEFGFAVNYQTRLRPAEVWFDVLQPKSREVRTESVEVPLESVDQFVSRVTALYGGFVLTNRSRLNALNS